MLKVLTKDRKSQPLRYPKDNQNTKTGKYFKKDHQIMRSLSMYSKLLNTIKEQQATIKNNIPTYSIKCLPLPAPMNSSIQTHKRAKSLKKRTSSHKSNAINAYNQAFFRKKRQHENSHPLYIQQRLRIKSSKKRKKRLIPMQYELPKSQSSSFIVFSDKGSTLNNTILKKDFSMQRKIFKPENAATLIQKIWKGYMTRKLLQEYINAQEPRLQFQLKQLISSDQSEQDINSELSASYIQNTIQSRNSCNQSQIKKSLGREESAREAIGEISADRSRKNIKDSSKYNSPNEQTDAKPRKYIKNAYPNVPQDSFWKQSSSTLIDPSPSLNKEDASEVSPYLQKNEKELRHASMSFHMDILPQKNQKTIKQLIVQIQGIFSDTFKQSLKNHKLQFSNQNKTLEEMLKNCNDSKEIYHNAIAFLQQLSINLNSTIEQIKVGKIEEESDNENDQQETHIKQSQPIKQVYEMPEINQCQNNNYFSSKSHYELYTYFSNLLSEYQNQNSERQQSQFLCHVLHSNASRQPRNIKQRYYLQFLIQVVTQKYPLQAIVQTLQNLECRPVEGLQEIVRKWVKEAEKWEMAVIPEATQAMESSSFLIIDNLSVSESV